MKTLGPILGGLLVVALLVFAAMRSQRVLEANPAALALLGQDARKPDSRKVVGSVFSDLFDKASRQAALSFAASAASAADRSAPMYLA